MCIYIYVYMYIGDHSLIDVIMYNSGISHISHEMIACTPFLPLPTQHERAPAAQPKATSLISEVFHWGHWLGHVFISYHSSWG